MENIINRLDLWIKKNRSAYYQQLNTGLTNEEITNWETKFGFEFTEDFKLLYKWKNGQSANSRDFFFGSYFFGDMQQVYEQWKFGVAELAEDNEEGSMAWGQSWLRFMSMLSSDGYCLDVKGDLAEPGNIVYYIHDDINEVIYTDLKTMLETIVTQFEQK